MTGGYPAQDHWARRQALGMDAQSSFHVPAIQILEKLTTDSAEQDASAARSHRKVNELLAPPRQPATLEEAKSTILALCSPHPELSDEEREAATEMTMEILTVLARLDSFVAAKQFTERSALKQRHVEVYRQCRELSDKVAELQHSHGYQSNLLMGFDEKRVKCSVEHSTIRDRRPARYPSAEELAEWKQELDSAEQKLVAAGSDYNDAQEALEQTAYELQATQRELAAYESEESQLREKLSLIGG